MTDEELKLVREANELVKSSNKAMSEMMTDLRRKEIVITLLLIIVVVLMLLQLTQH